MTISQKDAVVRSEVYKANQELVRDLVAFHFPEVAAPLRTVDRSSYHDVMLRQIQTKNEPKFLSLLIRNNRMDEVEEILACPHPAISHAIHGAIRWAAQEGRIVALERLLKDPRANVNFKCNDKDQSPLHLAVTKGHTEIVDLLLRHNAEVETADLREAVARHYNHIVQQLSPQITPDESVLLLACEFGNYEIQNSIIYSFPDIPMNNNTLYWAIHGVHPDIVRDVLGREGVHPMEFVYGTMGSHLNALTLAANRGHSDIVDILLADPRVDPSWNQNLALRRAAYQGHPDIVLKILKHPLPVRRSFLLKWIHNFYKKQQVKRFVNDGKRENHNALTQEEWAVVYYIDESRGTTTDVGEFWQAAMDAEGTPLFE